MKLSLSATLLVCLTVILAACSGGPNPSPHSENAPSGTEAEKRDAEHSAGEGTPGESGGDGDDSGPVVATGLEGFCEHYFECGGAHYADVEACIEASEGHWGACRRPELDAFGDCMMNVSCEDWNPSAYHPGSTPCAEEWSTMTGKTCS